MGSGLLRMMDSRMAGRLEPSKGFLRAHSSYRTQPRAHMSLFWSYRCP